jgi:hypothetical protein
MLDGLKERNILKLILIVRFACATVDAGHPISSCLKMIAESQVEGFHEVDLLSPIAQVYVGIKIIDPPRCNRCSKSFAAIMK